jgi:DeoR family transcriptional regulator of aga operon
MGTLRIKQVIAGHCARLILLVDYSKFGQRSLCKVLDVSQIHTIVTDSQAPQEAIDLLKQKGHEVQVADLKGWREWENGNAA